MLKNGFALFQHISNGKYAWYPPNYGNHPVFGPDLLAIMPTGPGDPYDYGGYGETIYGGSNPIQGPWPDIPRYPY